MKNFYQKRLKHFGDYQDALEKNEVFTIHSLISPLLIPDFFTPDLLSSKPFLFARNHSVGLNNLEGFIRQIAGWARVCAGRLST